MTDNDSAWGPGENPEDFPTRASRRRSGREPGTGPISEVPRFADRLSPAPQESSQPGPASRTDDVDEDTVRRPVLDIRFDESAHGARTMSVPVVVPQQTVTRPVPPAPSATPVPPAPVSAPSNASEDRMHADTRTTTTTPVTTLPGVPSVPSVPADPPRQSRRQEGSEGRRRSFLASDNGTVPAETGFRDGSLIP